MITINLLRCECPGCGKPKRFYAPNRVHKKFSLGKWCSMHTGRLTRTGHFDSLGIRREIGQGHLRKDGYKDIAINGVRKLEHRLV